MTAERSLRQHGGWERALPVPPVFDASRLAAASTMLRALSASLPRPGQHRQALGIDLPIAVINLAHRTDRWSAVQSRMAGVGLDRLIQMPAVVGAQLDLEAFAPLLGPSPAAIEAPPEDHLSLTRPAVGCYLSHLALWQWMLDHEVPRLLVFEDDARPAESFDAERCRQILMAPEVDAGLVFVGGTIMDGLAEPALPGAFARLFYFTGTFGYLITPAVARALLPRLLPMRAHIDHAISDVLIHHRHDVAAFHTEPALFEPDWSLRSDCYVPLTGGIDADNALGARLAAHRATLRAEGWRLLPPYVSG